MSDAFPKELDFDVLAVVGIGILTSGAARLVRLHVRERLRHGEQHEGAEARHPARYYYWILVIVIVIIDDKYYWFYLWICILWWPEWVARALREGTPFVIISALNVGHIFYMPMCAAARSPTSSTRRRAAGPRRRLGLAGFVR
jgi:hypothetical protein